MMDAYLTAETIINDFLDHQERSITPPNVDIKSLAQGQKVVSWEDWQEIDRAEREAGRKLGKEREKFTSIQSMLNVLS